MNTHHLLLAIPLAIALPAAAADSTAVHGPNYDPVRHAKVQAAIAAGDTAAVNALRSEHRSQMQAGHQGKAGSGRGGHHGRAGGGMGSCPGRQAGTATP